MNDAAKWWYYVRQNGGYYPGALASLGYNVWDWNANRKTGYINGEETTLLWQDSAKTTPVTTNGHPVGAWVDGVQGVDAIQATTANKPAYATNSLNGLPTLSFDGGDLLATGNISISTFAVWVVYQSGNGVIYEQSVIANTNDGMYLYTVGNPLIAVRRAVYITKNGTASNDNTWRIVRTEHDGTFTGFNAFYNNGQVTVSGSGTNLGTGTATAPLFIGARSGVALPMTGNIAHLCIVSPYPTAAIIAQMESYINSKWSVY